MRNKIIVVGILVIILMALLITGCNTGLKELTPEQISAEKAAIEDVVTKFHKSLEDESWTEFKALLTEDCIIYGTDVAEVDQGFEELEPHMNVTFELLEGLKIFDIKNKSFNVGSKFASIMYGSTWDTNLLGQQVSMPIRVAMTFKKDETWKISQCMLSVPSVGQSGKELIEQMKNK